MPSTQASTHSPRLSIHIATLIASQEQCSPRNLIRHSTPLQRIQLPDLPFRASRAGIVEDRGRHARFDQTGTDGVDSDARANQLEGRRLRDGNHGRFAGRVIGGAGIGAQTRD